MSKMRKFVSPRTGRKVIELPNKTFGVSLDELLRQSPAENGTVPSAVKKICEHIYKHGVDQEGIFRVSGSARAMDKLKTSFNVTGDADLDGEPDIMAVAGLLKLFLRELPDSLIPEHLTQEFIAIETGKSNEQDYILRLRSRLHSLPEENAALLKYIVSFLVAVSHHQTNNKMSPMALAIVFGPNIFRCGDGISGLKDQGTINLIVAKFISHYSELFREDDECEPVEMWTAKVKKTPPPRPPPPQIATTSLSSNTGVLRPVPVPSLTKVLESAQYDSKRYQEGDVEESVNEASGDGPVSHGTDSAQLSPHFSDEEPNGRSSPFILESESLSIIESPMPTARTSELLQKTICDAISDRLFGGELAIGAASPVPTRSSETVPSEHRLDGLASSVRAKVEMYERKNSLSDYSTSESSSNLPPNVDGSNDSKVNKADFQHKENACGDFSHGIFYERTTARLDEDVDVLSSGRKTSGPLLRRLPSERRLHSNQESRDVDLELTGLLEETAIVVTCGDFQTRSGPESELGHHCEKGADEKASKEDINHNQQLALFVDDAPDNIRETDGTDDLPLPQPSPLSKHKPFIPPLDLSILHEHVDGSAPILASNSGTWDKKLPKSPFDDTKAVPSPRVSKLKKRNGEASNTDIPPSPPNHQDQYHKHMDDEFSHRLKQMTKRIQVLKKKIKIFEEEFEADHGYKPSQGEKAARPEIKKYMAELSRTRKDIKRLREDCEQGNRSRHGSGASSSGDTPKVEETLRVILITLKEKRQDASRPEDITLMTRDQVQEEKLAVQKALLHFEGIHGRPTLKEDKDVMRPLYDRYRLIKRLLSRPMSPRNSLDLPTVPEDGMIEIPVGSAMGTGAFRHPIFIPTADLEEERIDTMDFAVTHNLSDLRYTGFQEVPGQLGGVFPKVRKKNDLDSDQESSEAYLHELNVYQLHEKLEQSKAEKKQLRHQLREFEKGFQEKHGRKVQKEDRSPMQDSYQRYKQLKARLRLLEALVLKHQE